MTKKQIKDIIEDEIEVDAYGEDEIASGWEIFMSDNMYYPFTTECKIRRKDKVDTYEKVEVIRENETYNSLPKIYCVDVLFSGFIFTVRLDDLRNVEANEETERAILVWTGRGRYY